MHLMVFGTECSNVRYADLLTRKSGMRSNLKLKIHEKLFLNISANR